MDPAAETDLVLRMNALLNETIDDEVGNDDGSFLPSGDETPWAVDRWDL